MEHAIPNKSALENVNKEMIGSTTVGSYFSHTILCFASMSYSNITIPQNQAIVVRLRLLNSLPMNSSGLECVRT
jgi:hypothetical protein